MSEVTQEGGPAVEYDEDSDDASDRSDELSVLEDELDRQMEDELAMGVMSRLMPRHTFWETFTESQVVKMTFLCGPDALGSFAMIFMTYGWPSVYALYTLLFFFGFPLVCLELFLGQYTSQNPLTLYGQMVPAFEGLGYSVMLLNFFIIGAQVQQVALFAGLAIESISPGDDAKQYDTCSNLFNNYICQVDHPYCPPEQPLWLENICVSNTSYKWNVYLDHRRSYHEEVPYNYPMFQFLFRGILGESDHMYVRSDLSAEGVLTYSAIWCFVFVANSNGWTSVIKDTAIVTNTAMFVNELVYVCVTRFWERPLIWMYPEVTDQPAVDPAAMGIWADQPVRIYIKPHNFHPKYVPPDPAISHRFVFNETFERTGAILDMDLEPDLLRQPDMQMWMMLAVHILSFLGLGDGGLVTIASRQNFSAWILKDAVILLLIWSVLPIWMAMGLQGNITMLVLQRLRETPDYYEMKRLFVETYHHFVERSSYHTNMFSWAFSLLLFKEYHNVLLTLLTITGALFTLTSVLIRFEILAGSMTDQLIGQPDVVQKCLLRATVAGGFMLMLCMSHRHGLLYLEAFYKYGLVTIVGCIILIELVLILIYRPFRVFANLNAMQLSWPSVRRSLRLRTAFEMANLVLVYSWVLLPVFIGTTVIYNVQEPLTFGGHFQKEAKWIGLLVALFVMSPTLIIFTKRMYWRYQNQTAWRMEWAPVRRLWGPRIVTDRTLATHVELEFGITE